jgi:hypothetical protein
MPELDFELHAWPGYPASVVEGAVRHAVRRASAGTGVGSVRVIPKGPFAARVTIGAPPSLAGVIARAVDVTLERLRDPSARRSGTYSY